MQWSRCPSLSLQSGCCYDCQGTTPQSHSWKTKGKMSVKEITTNTEHKKKKKKSSNLPLGASPSRVDAVSLVGRSGRQGQIGA